MGRVRPCLESDIPQVADVHERAFSTRNSSATPGKKAYFREVFFHNPWYDESLPSLVYEEGDRIIGFVGVIPRRMVMNGQPVQAAVSTSFAVEPSERSSLAGIHLLRALLSGPQDVTIAESNDLSRKIWERLGGSKSLLNSIRWMCPLRPARYIAHHLTKGRLAPLGIAAVPVANGVDFVAARLAGSLVRQRPAPELSAEALTVDSMLSYLPRFLSSHSFVPEYDEPSLEWLFRILEGKKGRGTLQKVALRDAAEQVAGWYVYYAKQGDVSQVVQIVARADAADQVVDHLFHDAWRRGAMALSGRLEPQLITQYPRKGCLLARDYSWLLVSTSNPEIMHAINQGEAFISRLEAEWWVPFHGDTLE